MNVNDQWMLEKMQQMAANMAASLPQTGQNAETSQTEKGDSFKDMLDKAKEQKVETPKKDSAPEKKEPVQSKQPAQKAEQTQTVKPAVNGSTKKVELTPPEAAMLVAGYAKLSPPAEDGTVWFVTVQDENGSPVLPLAALEDNGANLGEVFVQDQWTMEPTEELTSALEQLLQETNDPRSVQDILGKLEQKLETPQTEPETEPKMEITIKAPEMEQTDDQDETNLDAQVMTARKPLFHDVKATPVKVGENFQLDTQEPDMDANLADAIRFAAQQGLRQIEIKLSPENLGNLTVKLTQAADGTLQVVLHTANAKAANLLVRHMDGLNAALQGYSQNNEVRVEVQRNEDSQQAQYQQADPDGHNRQSQQQQQQQQEESHSGDFLQKLRLGLFSLEDA